jgi:hypothetical protein
MLLRFAVQNHRSIRDEQELSLVASAAIKDSSSSLIRPDGLELEPGVLPLAIIYGANASGKSNVLCAIDAMAQAVRDSYRTWKDDGGVHRWPFVLEEAWRSKPSEYGADFVVSGTRYRYGFEANNQAILREWLYAWPKGRQQVWFEREAGRPIRFGRHVTGGRAVESITRQNSLFLSAAKQSGHARLAPVAGWFWNLKLARRDNEPARLEYAASQVATRGWQAVLRDLLLVADLGILRVEAATHKLPKQEREQLARVLGALGNLSPEKAREEAARPRPRLLLKHRARKGSVKFTMEDESRGTIALMALAYPVLDALARGEVLLVDELESSMHPELAQALVHLFLDPEANTGGGQLICATHSTHLLNTANLRRDSVWFTEKSREGATKLFPLTDFRTRKNASVETGYLQGRFGAVPLLGDFTDVVRAVSSGS